MFSDCDVFVFVFVFFFEAESSEMLIKQMVMGSLVYI